MSALRRSATATDAGKKEQQMTRRGRRSSSVYSTKSIQSILENPEDSNVKEESELPENATDQPEGAEDVINNRADDENEDAKMSQSHIFKTKTPDGKMPSRRYSSAIPPRRDSIQVPPVRRFSSATPQRRASVAGVSGTKSKRRTSMSMGKIEEKQVL